MTMLVNQRGRLIVSGLLFTGGVVVGMLASRAIHSPIDRELRTLNEKRSAEEKRNGTNKTASVDRAKGESVSKLLLGNIATVPFQELYSAMASRSAQELAEAAEQLKALTPGRETNKKIEKFFKAWSQLDPKAAYSAAISFKTVDGRSAALSAVIEGADPTAAEWLARQIGENSVETLPPDRRRLLIGTAVTKWSELDAPTAARFLDSFPVSGGKFFADWHTIAANWALSDAQGALAWALQHDANDMVKFATSGAISGWWQKDPRAAESYVSSHLQTLADWQMASTLADEIFRADPKHAMEWVSALPSVEARRQADSLIASQMSWTDPKAAAEWAATLPADVRGEIVGSVVGQWAQGNAAAAANWIGTLSGVERDQAVRGLSSGLAANDPASAISWASSITDPKMRDTAIDRVVATWMRQNASNATAWVQNSGLSEDRKKQLLTPPPPHG